MNSQDEDFPAPPHLLAIDRGVAEIKADVVFTKALSCLDGLARHDASMVAWASYDWLQINEAGTPYVPLLEEAVRDDARFWAETATPAELECYALAAVDRLANANAMFASRQIKRLVGALWRRMSPEEQKAFVGWIVKDLQK